MKRIITIKNPLVYKGLWLGFVMGGDKLAETGSAVVRVKSRIKKAIKSVGIDDPTDKNIPFKIEDEVKIIVGQEEYEILIKYLEALDWKTGMADIVEELFDCVGTAVIETEGKDK